MKYRDRSLVSMVRLGFIGLALLAVILLVARQARTQDAQPATQDAQPATQDAQPATQDAQPATQDAQPAAAEETSALGTTFNYSGLLNDGSANGAFDFQFKLFSAATGGTQIGSTITRDNLQVKGGLFDTSLDFGAFTDQLRYLEVGVRPGNQTGAYTILSPRRPISPVPVAMFSDSTRGLTVTAAGDLAVSKGSVTAWHPAGNGAAITLGFGADSSRLRVGGSSSTGAPFNSVFKLQGPADTTYFRSDGNGTRFYKSLALYPEEGVNAAIGLFFNEKGTQIRLGGGGPFISGLDINRFDTRIARFDSSGLTVDRALTIRGGADLAERFEVSGGAAAEPGTVMVIDPDNPGHLTAATTAYDTRVAGVVSGAGDIETGLVLSQEGVLEGDTVVAIAGRVYVRAEALSGPITPGDMLTTSDLPGYAMAVTDYERAHGTVIGKAMTGLESGTGLVLVLINLQ